MNLVHLKLALNGRWGYLARRRVMNYELRFKVSVQKSPFRENWYAKVEIEGAEEVGAESYLTGNGDDAVTAVQSALRKLGDQQTYPQLVIETGLMYGTRTAKRIGDGKKR